MYFWLEVFKDVRFEDCWMRVRPEFQFFKSEGFKLNSIVIVSVSFYG